MNELKVKADEAKMMYKTGHINRREAFEVLQPFIDSYNNKAAMIAKKYNQRPKLVSVYSYLR